MKKLSVLVFFCCGAAFADGPIFQHKDTFDQQEFENAYQNIRAISIFSISGTIRCIDSPTFCVDTTNHRLGFGTAAPADPLDVFISGVNAFSLDTSGQFTFTGRINTISNSNNGNTQLVVTNSNAGTGALSTIFASNGTTNTYLEHFGGSYVGTLFGQNLAGAGVLENGSAGSGLFINTLNANSVIIGANSTKRITVTSTGAQIVGDTSGSNATAGTWGEAVKSYVASNQSIAATGVGSDLTSISLTAGDWDVWASWAFAPGTGTVSGYETCISTVSGNDSVMCTRADTSLQVFPPNATLDSLSNVIRLVLTSSQSAYLKNFTTYTSGLPVWKGKIYARRASH